MAGNSAVYQGAQPACGGGQPWRWACRF